MQVSAESLPALIFVHGAASAIKIARCGNLISESHSNTNQAPRAVSIDTQSAPRSHGIYMFAFKYAANQFVCNGT